ncbi:hypothetical protein ACFLSA_05795 [Bacteroidota bacterium]
MTTFLYNIRNSINKKYSGGRLTSAKLTETGTGIEKYEIKVDTDKFVFELELDKEGKIISTKKIQKQTLEEKDNTVGSSGDDT